jgi:prevent-host-death family protein
MDTINIHDAKTHLSRIVEDVAAGSEVVIAKAGKPMARLVPLGAARRKISFGLLKGKIRIASDFDAPLPETILSTFEGR